MIVVYQLLLGVLFDIEGVFRRIQMKRLFLVGLCFFALSGSWSSDDQKSLDQIEKDLQELKDMKLGYEARAIRAEDQADRLQFEDNFVLETRRYYKIAEANRENAARVQEEIDRLEIRKDELLKRKPKLGG
jgi:hypothetical protein